MPHTVHKSVLNNLTLDYAFNVGFGEENTLMIANMFHPFSPCCLSQTIVVGNITFVFKF